MSDPLFSGGQQSRCVSGASGKRVGKKTAAGLHRAAHDPRAAALLVLMRVVFEGKDSQAALDEVLRSPLLVPSDKALCTELVYGSLRRYLRLDWFVRRFLPKPEKLPPELLLTLLLILYEMAFLRTPHHAGVNWAVSHAKSRFGPGMSKVANGTLRAMQRELEEFHSPALYLAPEGQACADVESVETESLARLHAVPAWLARLWLRQYGRDEARLLLEASSLPAPAGVRVNMGGDAEGNAGDWQALLEELRHIPEAISLDASGTALDVVCRSADCVPGAIGQKPPLAAVAFPGGLPWQARKAVAEGRASRQSAASYAALIALKPSGWPGPLWDCCAGRGGKTLALLEMGLPVALATDPSRRRITAISEEYARLRLSSPPCPHTLTSAAAYAQPQLLPDVLPGEGFGTVLVDAPCSGLGTLSRRPEIRLRRTEADIAALSRTQRKILEEVWPCLRSGGLLIYLTCTRTHEENQQQVLAFLDRHPDAALEKEHETPAASPLREFFYGARIRKA